jgi:hypothetical protein
LDRVAAAATAAWPHNSQKCKEGVQSIFFNAFLGEENAMGDLTLGRSLIGAFQQEHPASNNLMFSLKATNKAAPRHANKVETSLRPP